MKSDSKVEAGRWRQRALDAEALNAELMGRWFRTFDLLPERQVEGTLARARAALAGKPDPTPQEPPCGVCLGRPRMEAPCLCGGSGRQGDEVIGLRKALYKATAINDAARALVDAFDCLRRALG